MELYHELSMKQKNIFIVVDATAKLLDGLQSPFDERKPYYYTIFTRCPEKGVTGVPIFEFATTSQTFPSISQGFLQFLERYFENL
jgi:hypothetical protein